MGLNPLVAFSNKDKQETNTIDRKVGEYSENDKKE